MRSFRVLPVLAAAMLAVGCGSGDSSLKVVNVDSEGNVISSPAGADAMSSEVTEPAADPSAGSVTAASSASEADITAPADTQPEKKEFSLSSALEALGGIGSDSVPSAFGSAVPSEEAMNALKEQVSAIISQGHKVSFVLLDIDTLSGVSYNSKAAMCAQSVIKAAYIGSLVESDPSVFTSEYEAIHDSIAYSDNDSYVALREKYGTDCLRKWCSETGVSSGIADSIYPVMNASDMLKLWIRLYSYFSSGDTGAKVAKLYEASIGSAGRQLFMGKYTVQSKAGWECGLGSDAVRYDPDKPISPVLTDGDPYNDECAANDAGIVYTASGTFLYAIFTDIPFGVFHENTPPNPLTALLSAMNNARSR